MQNSKDIIKNDKYRNWVKGTLGIEQTNRAVCEYVKEKFTLYLQGKARLNSQQNVTQSYLTAAELSHLRDDMKALFRQRLKSLVKYKLNKTSGREEWHWDSRTYNCTECKGTFQKLLSLHKGQINNLNSISKKPDFRDIHWENSNDTRNLSLEWAIAKIFMPKGNEQNKGPEDTDPSAMFSLMARCDLFTHPIKGTNLTHLIDARNNLFHSSDNLVSDVVVEDYFRLMKNLLVDASCDPEIGSSIRNRICEDIKKIEKLKDSEMTMTLFEDAKKAIRIARKAIYYDFEERLCNNDPDQLRELLKLAVKLGSDLQFLNDHFDELKHQNEEIKELQKASDEKQNQIRNLQMHIDEKQNAMKIMQEQIDEKNLKISEMEKELDDQVAENVKLSKESADDKEEIRSMQYKISDHLEEIDNLRKQYDEKLTEIKDNCNKIKRLNNLCAGQHSEIEELRNANDELKTQNAEKEGKIAGLLKQIGDHEDEIKSLHQKNESSRFEIEELRIDKEEQTIKNAMLQKERDCQSLEIKELHDKNKYHLSETEKLREEKDNMLSEISALRKKGDDQQLEIKQLHEQIESQRRKITEQLCENHNLREQNEEKTGEINKVLKENHEFLQEIKELHRNITSSCAQVDEQQKQICDLKKSRDEKSNEVHDMQKLIADRIEEIKTLKNEIGNLHGKLLDLGKQDADKCNNIQELKAKLFTVETQKNAQHNEVDLLRMQKDNLEWETVVIASVIALSSLVYLGE